MKLLLALLAVVVGTFGSAFASDAPHIAVEGEVWLVDASGTPLFTLPEGYYVRIDNLDENFYYLRFNGVSGKVDKNAVSTVGYHTSVPGTECEIGIAEEFGEFSGINLKSAPGIAAESVLEVPIAAKLTFIGEYPTDEELWYYVRYDDVYGYIRADRTSMPEPDYPAFTPEPAPDIPASVAPEEEEEENTIIRIVIIAGLAIPAVALVVYLFRRNKKRYAYEEYRYRPREIRPEPRYPEEEDYRNENYSGYRDERYSNDE